MTNSSFSRGKRIVNPYAKKPVISNPYAKKPAAANNVTPMVKSANNNAASNNKPSYNHLNRPAGTTPKAVAVTRPHNGNAAATVVSRSNNPYATTTAKKAVTPTPKKQIVAHKHKPSSLSKATIIKGSSTAGANAHHPTTTNHNHSNNHSNHK